MRKPTYLAALCGFAILAATWAAENAHAVEPARDFLMGLRERGYYDVALDYLEAMADSPLAPIELRQTIQLEKGITLIEASRVQRDQVLREQYLNDAQALLNEFSQKNAAHPKANSARSQLGNLIVERARMKVEASKNDANKGKKDQLLKEANALYEQAYKVFSDLQESVKVQLERIPKVLDPKNKQQAKMIARRTQLRADFLQTLLLAAAIREETADTLVEGSDPFKKVLEEAAALYKDVYTKYRTRLAGLYARMYQGRANQRLGKLKDALGYYTELLDQPDSPDEFRVLKTKTLRLAMEAWLDESQKKYMEAIKQADPWVKKSRPTEDGHSDWLAIRLSLARAYQMQADDLGKQEPVDKRAVSQSLAAARKVAQFVASRSGEFQDAAKELVADLGGPDRTGEKEEPKNFAEAMEAGREALNAFATGELAVKKLDADVKRQTDAAAKATATQQLEAAQQSLSAALSEALDYYHLALNLIDDDTSIQDINVVRYFICYLYYKAGDPYKASVMGEFVSRRYPDSAGARDCATISMASYAQIYSETNVIAAATFKAADTDTDGALSLDELQAANLDGGADKDGNGSVSVEELAEYAARFEASQVVSVAQYIVDKWPDQGAAQDALVTLVPFMINAGELDRAQEYATKMPEGSAKRGDAELKTGQAMWGTYLRDTGRLKKAREDGSVTPDEATAEEARLAELKDKALQILLAGFARSQASAKPDKSIVTACLSLAQASLESQQHAKAIEVLEHATIGPLTLANANHAAITRAAVKEEIYKTALRSYISALATDSGAIDKANGVMTNMKAAIGEDAAGQKRLQSVYVSLAQDLEKQLAAADPESKRTLSQGFETFLSQISSGATELPVLNWVAESFSKLGAGLDDGETLNDEAKKYYNKSSAAYQNILDKSQLSDQQKMHFRLKIASLAGQMRDFEKALSTFEEILGSNASRLAVQVEAAKLVELWAKQPGQEAKYLEAISGVRKSGQPQPTIWGWGRIANRTSNNPKYIDTFHEARLHVAECRLAYSQTDGADKEKMLKDAVKELRITRQLYSDLGGEASKARYDDVLKRIQAAQGAQAIGLKAFESKTPAAGG